MASAEKVAKEDKGNDHVASLWDLVREGINGYVFWCLFQGLAPMIWFYPLNELDISGYEAFAGLWFTQLLAGIPGVRGLIETRYGLFVLRGATVASLASFQAPSTLARLVSLALGNGLAMLTLTATLWHSNRRLRCLTVWGLMLGYVAFVASRVWFVSFVPAWWTQTSNSAVIAIATVAVVDQLRSDVYAPPVKSSTPRYRLDQPPTVSTGLGLGSLLFLLSWALGEASVITRWTVRAYPDHGPDPYPWGAGTLLALGFGAYMAACRHMAISKIWWLIGLVSLAALYYLPTWQGYCGGLVLAVYALSVLPEMMERASRCPPGRTLFLTIVMFLVQSFFLVWTVAYNFVPLGVYTRERTDVLILMNMAGIFIGLFLGGTLVGGSNAAYVTTKAGKMPSNKYNTVLLLILCVGLLGFGVRYDPDRYNHPVKKSPKHLTSAIWTYHFGYDNKGWPSLERTAQLLNNTGADVITLLESDASKPFLGNNDLGMWLEERLGMYVDFGPSTKDHTWGNLILFKYMYPFVKSTCHLLPSPHRDLAPAVNMSNLILSKYPFVKSTHHLLPSPHGELAPAVTATVNMSGSLVDFVVTHMGNDRDVLDRKLQAEFLAKELRESENPVVFMGYVTSRPGSREYEELLSSGNVKDIDDTDRKRFCEYIMYRGLRRLGYARVSHGGLSDTELQMARFEIVEDQHKYKDNKRVVYDMDAKNIPDDVRFSEKFGGFHRGHGYFPYHRFHMDTPKYFLP